METQLQTGLRASAMSAVLGYDERLLYFVFHHKELRLREEAPKLLREARFFSHGERVLIQCAIDLWNDGGGAKFSEVLGVLDDDHLLQLLRGVLKFREIEDERRLLLLEHPWP